MKVTRQMIHSVLRLGFLVHLAAKGKKENLLFNQRRSICSRLFFLSHVRWDKVFALL